ncbi:MAG: sigma-E factor negative regulatory protein [Cellvibrionales bacterium]|jgi:negative regulator of sigma E activity|nr:sigma-E factor negative regulatory protein [Cellvibrionales bacterium]MBK8675297.1 sigma-E factor negative regulatory protein [Cellvibrionales bacterium]HRF87448.1 sigma-E factor negative regulatory protein [Pseudomonadales bacterium]HRG50089.1 sigma-E factor negative regulatory protein [Pseudomonadales bacterium]
MPSNSQSPFDKFESLSAVMDGAGHELELHRLLTECSGDEALRKHWARYQLASAALHKQPLALSDSLTFADSVRRAIDAEGESARGNDAVRGLSALHASRKVVARVAVAASVAMVVVIGAQWQQTSPEAVQQVAGMTPTGQRIKHSISVPAQKTLVGTLGVENIFAQSGGAQGMRMNNPQGFENAALKTDRSKVPLINTAEQSFPRK